MLIDARVRVLAGNQSKHKGMHQILDLCALQAALSCRHIYFMV